MGVEDTEPWGWRRLHWRTPLRSSPARPSFFTSNFIRSKSLTYSRAKGLLGSSEPMFSSVVMLPSRLFCRYASVAKTDLLISVSSLLSGFMQSFFWLLHRCALACCSMKHRVIGGKKCGEKKSRRKTFRLTLCTRFAS